MTSTSAKEEVTSSASGVGGVLHLGLLVVRRVGLDELAALPNVLAASAGVVPMPMPGLARPRATWRTSCCLVVTSQPRASTVVDLVGGGDGGPQRRMSVAGLQDEAGSSRRRCSPEGAPDDGLRLDELELALRVDGHHHLVLVGEPREEVPVGDVGLADELVRPSWSTGSARSGMPSCAASLRAMSEAVWLR